MFTNREIATGILLLAAFIWVLTKPEIRSSLRDVLRAFFNRSIVSVVVMYLMFVSLIIWLVSLTGAWTVALLKDTVLIALTVGFPLVMRSTSTKDGASLTRGTIRQVLGLSAILVFYINLSSLAIVGELILQVVVTVAVMVSVVAKHQSGTSRVVGKVMDGLLGVIGLGILTFTTIGLIRDPPSAPELLVVGQTFGMSIWLPLALLPFVYVLAFYAAVESLFSVLPILNRQTQPSWKVRLGILLGFRGSVRYATHFTGRWRLDVAGLTSYRKARHLMQRYRRSVRADAAATKAAAQRLRDNAGLTGVDEYGRQLDQREFEGTKKALEQLAMFQMGQHRNRLHHYNPDLLQVLGRGGQFGLPNEHDIQMVLAPNKQRWYAWRQTIGGWVLAVGGTKDIDLGWRYEGAEPPTGFPSLTTGWKRTDSLSDLPNWVVMRADSTM